MSGFVTVLRWIFAVWLILGALLGVAQIGKPRKPTTPGTAIAVLIFTAAVVWLLVGAR